MGLGLGLTTAYAAHSFLRPSPSQYLYCDGSPSPVASSKDWSYSHNANTPVVANGRPNPAAYKQISSGSILGLLGGLAVSTFSRTLAILFGLFIFTVQAAASRGFNIIPYNRMQRYVQGIDLRSAIYDNVAFKLSFGATFALAAFAEF